MIPSGCRVHLPVTSPTSAAFFPKRFKWVGFPEYFRKETSCGMNFEIVAIPYVQASWFVRSEEHTSELQSHSDLVCRLLLEKKNRRDSSSSMQLVLLADRQEPRGRERPSQSA